MLEANHFPQFDLPRLTRARERVEAMIWQIDPTPITVEQSKPAHDHTTFAQAQKLTYKPVNKRPHHWGKVYDQCWWRIKLPRIKNPDNTYLLWKDQGEATLYADGQPVYGIDPGHKHAPLRAGVRKWMIESICCRTGVWVTGEINGIDAQGSRFDGASLAIRDDHAWAAFHDLDVLIQLLDLSHLPDYPQRGNRYNAVGYRPELHAADPAFRWLLEQLSLAVDALDRQGVPALRNQLAKTYRGLQQDDDKLKGILTGHAHIDLVWLWPERVGEFKAIHTFSNALSLLERYPEVHFGYSQPASYQAVSRRCPKLMDRVDNAIQSGHWEPTGAMYVESDTQLACGEALARSVALGQQGFRQLRGDDSKVLWLPDVFGYSGCIPQILAGFGVPYFFTTKLHWSTAQRFPYTSFRWIGHDGSEVLSHVIWNHYNMAGTPQEVRELAEHHRQTPQHPELLIPTGYGDGGGGPTEAMAERARRMTNLRGLPKTEWGTIEGFFDRMAQHTPNLPAWRGEVYLEFHRGVQTTHAELKRLYRRAERGLQMLEAVHAVNGNGPIDPTLWERVVFAQFHDYLPGSSVKEVYDEALPELADIGDTTRNQAAKALKAKNKAKTCIFNPLPQPLTRAIDGAMRTLPPLAGVEVKSLPAIISPDVRITKRSLTSERVEARFDTRGRIESLIIDGEPIAFSAPAAEPWIIPDQPAMYDAWDIDRRSLSLGEPVSSKAQITIDESDELRPRLLVKRSLANQSSMTLAYSLDPIHPVLHLDLDIDLRDREKLLKLVFPTTYAGKQARYGAPFGSALRGQHAGPIAHETAFENPASRWMTVADETEADGMMLLAERTYGYGCREGLAHISLLRSPIMPRSGDTPLDKSGRPTADVADLGSHHIRLAVGRYTSDADLPDQPASLAETLFAEPIEYRGTPTPQPLQSIEGLSSVIPSWAQPEPGGGLTLRLHETLGQRGWIELNLAGKTWNLTDLAGTPTTEPTTNPCVVEVKPYQIISVRVA
ncbi:MAG: glycoside hydrolase family 38 C-terminal domain-containing protein [Phycisphaeraceae bacterium]